MDTSVHHNRSARQTPSAARKRIPQKLEDHSLDSAKHNSLTPASSDCAVSCPPRRHCHDRDPWHDIATSKSAAPRLVPLISKFEELDAASLRSSVRGVQPAHLHLPRSRNSYGRKEDKKSMISTRERLLKLSERPGWGCTTLRGLRGLDIGNDPIAAIGNWDERGHPMVPKVEHLFTTAKPRIFKSKRWHGNEKERAETDRRESKVRERIKYFDDSMDNHPAFPGRLRNWSLTDRAVASHPSSQSSTTQFLATLPKASHMTPCGIMPQKNYYMEEMSGPPWTAANAKSCERYVRQSEASDRRLVRGRTYERIPQPVFLHSCSNIGTTLRGGTDMTGQTIGDEISPLPAIQSEGRRQDMNPSLYSRAKKRRSEMLEPKPDSTHCSRMRALPVDAIQNDIRKVQPDNHKSCRVRIRKEEALRMSNMVEIGVNIVDNEFSRLETCITATPPRYFQSSATSSPSPSTSTSPSPLLSPSPSPLISPHVENQVKNNGDNFIEAITPQIKGLCSHTSTIALQNSPWVLTDNSTEESTPAPKQEISQRRQANAYNSSSRIESQIKNHIRHFEALTPTKPTRIVSGLEMATARRLRSGGRRVDTWPLLGGKKPATRDNSEIMTESNPIKIKIKVHGTNNKAKTHMKTRQEKLKERQKLHSRQEHLTRRSRSRSTYRLKHSRESPERSPEPVTEIEAKTQPPPHPTGGFKGSPRSPPPLLYADTGKPATEISLKIDSMFIPLGISDFYRPRHQDWKGFVHKVYPEEPQGKLGRKDEAVAVKVVSRCALIQPKPVRVTETMRIERICRGH